MAHKHKSKHDKDGTPPSDEALEKFGTKDYERELQKLHGELVALQEWVKATGTKICIVFEGRDTAGKGGTIKAITERVSPRVFRVVALPAPTDREKSQMYLQRYVRHLPAGGEIAIFDRSWYNRAGVEPVMGFCTPEQTERFLDQVPAFEKAMVDSKIILLKYWLEVSADEQTRRLESRIHDPRKIWKLSDMDLKSYSRWYDYSRARDQMFAKTDTAWAPWFVADTNDKKRGRLNIITHLLEQVPYEPIPHNDITLPKRQRANGYTEPSANHAGYPQSSEPHVTPVADSDAHDRAEFQAELWHEGIEMMLYVSVVLIAEIAALPHQELDGGVVTGPTGGQLLAIVWGTTLGLAVAHWFVFVFAARELHGHGEGLDMQLGLAQFAGAFVVAALSSIPVFLFDDVRERQYIGFVPALLIGITSDLIARRRGRSRVAAAFYGVTALAVGVAVAGIKSALSAH